MIILKMISIHKMEYESIINENKSLKLIITRALGYEFKEELPTNMTIDELTLENKLLHSRIQQLEIKLDIELEKNKQHEQRIQSLESNNQILKAENVQLKEEIKELKSDINDLKLKDVYNSYIMAIQDTNSYQRLELTLPKHKKNLNKLRRNRNVSCHYIEEKDNDVLKTNKLYVLHEKLINMEPSLRSKFDKEFPNLIQDLIQYIEPLKTIPSEDELENISYWWE